MPKCSRLRVARDLEIRGFKGYLSAYGGPPWGPPHIILAAAGLPPTAHSCHWPGLRVLRQRLVVLRPPRAPETGSLLCRAAWCTNRSNGRGPRTALRGCPARRCGRLPPPESDRRGELWKAGAQSRKWFVPASDISGLPESWPRTPNRGSMWLHPESVSADPLGSDRKSTRLKSSHLGISYAVFC